MPVKKDRRKKGRNRRKGDVDIAGPTAAEDVRGRARGAVLPDRRRKGTIAGPTKARMRFGGLKFVRRIRKPWEGKRPAGGRTGKGREVSVGLVRRRETPRRTDIRGISRRVVGRAVGQDCWAEAGQRHTEVRSSYHFRGRTKVAYQDINQGLEACSQLGWLLQLFKPVNELALVDEVCHGKDPRACNGAKSSWHQLTSINNIAVFLKIELGEELNKPLPQSAGSLLHQICTNWATYTKVPAWSVISVIARSSNCNNSRCNRSFVFFNISINGFPPVNKRLGNSFKLSQHRTDQELKDLVSSKALIIITNRKDVPGCWRTRAKVHRAESLMIPGFKNLARSELLLRTSKQIRRDTYSSDKKAVREEVYHDLDVDAVDDAVV
ncbi:hypothetical protein BY996DRAFT_6532577 [Phakopsora pachyrhizi]|nr:hypothetical protein BY996DRAFT_6532577 [Phakopsora pachyrhizi]